jgi:hypothetical protein
MKQRLMIVILAGALILVQGPMAAQEHPGGMHGGGSGQQHMMGQGMMHNMGMMDQMMGDMQQMMGQGHMTPEQQRQMNEPDEPNEAGNAGAPGGPNGAAAHPAIARDATAA